MNSNRRTLQVPATAAVNPYPFPYGQKSSTSRSIGLKSQINSKFPLTRFPVARRTVQVPAAAAVNPYPFPHGQENSTESGHLYTIILSMVVIFRIEFKYTKIIYE